MGVYYNPVSDVVDRSVVEKMIYTHDYSWTQTLTPSGCSLYVLCDNGLHKFAMYIANERDFNELLANYKQGYLISFQPVALSPEAHQRALRDAGL